MNLKKITTFIFTLFVISNILFIITHYHFLLLIEFLLSFSIFILLVYVIHSSQNINTSIKEITENYPISKTSYFFSEFSNINKSIRKFVSQEKLFEAIHLNLTKKSTFDNYYPSLIENISLVFNSPHLAFLLYDPDLDQILFVSENGLLKKTSSQLNFRSIFSLNNQILTPAKFSEYFEGDFSKLKGISLITMNSLDYKGFLFLGSTVQKFDNHIFTQYSSLILEIQSSFNLHINQKVLKNKINELNLLNKLTTLMEKHRDIDEAIHIFLTYITAGEGLGFNRALFFRKNKNFLFGQNSVGVLSKKEAFKIWEGLEECPLDLYQKKPNVSSTIQSLTKSTSFNLHHDSKLKEIISTNSIWHGDIDNCPFSEKSKKAFKKFNLKNFILLPMSSYNESIGLLIVDNAFDNKKLTTNRIKSLQSFSNGTSSIIHNFILYNKVKEIATVDKLTSLHNRRFFDEKLTEEFNKAQRKELELSLIIIDIDYFKNYNDQNGHIAGDTLLETISKLFLSNSRKTDFVCRYGGEEFTLILADTNLDGAFKLAEKIRNAVDCNVFPFEETQPNKNLTISLGVVSLSVSKSKTIKELVSCADEALYYSKENGRNKVTSYPIKSKT